MTSTTSENGVVSAVTVLAVSPNVVTQVKTDEIDGYTAIQLGSEPTKKLGKALTGHFKKAKIMPKIVREIRVNELSEENSVGQSLGADTFNVGDKVDVTSISKGKGFAGTIKRHNFHRGRKTHGGRSYRRPGSIGSMYPQHILKGKKMSGQMGHEQVTVKNLSVALVDPELSIIGVVGAVPGPRKSIVVVKGTES
jgi:large subunit ribosomal protein L3